MKNHREYGEERHKCYLTNQYFTIGNFTRVENKNKSVLYNKKTSNNHKKLTKTEKIRTSNNKKNKQIPQKYLCFLIFRNWINISKKNDKQKIAIILAHKKFLFLIWFLFLHIFFSVRTSVTLTSYYQIIILILPSTSIHSNMKASKRKYTSIQKH